MVAPWEVDNLASDLNQCLVGHQCLSFIFPQVPDSSLCDDSGVHFAIIKILMTKFMITEGKFLRHLGYGFFQ
jgi:hypothetical protein